MKDRLLYYLSCVRKRM